MAPPARQRSQVGSLKREMRRNNGGKKAVTRPDPDAVPACPPPSDMGMVYPGTDTAFKALLSARFCAAIWSHVADCDETYNYWEPSHYLLFGKGLQTWEYSPEYALRSYTYLLLHVVPAWLYHRLLQPNRLLIFYFTRCLLGLLCTACEVFFYRSICREFGVQVGRLALAFLLFSAGMFVASTAFLPASFSMYMCLLSLGAWYQRKYELAVFTTALSSFLSWPFAALLGVPIAVDMILCRRQIMKFLQWSIISTLVILPPMVKMDSLYFGRLVVAPYNIIHYNVFTPHGPDLYGTEPWTFYFLNGFLNFNLVFVSALVTPLMLFLVAWLVPSKPRSPACLPFYLSLLPLYLWFAVFFVQPHKEERFLFPVYPLICLCGAISVDAAQKLWFRLAVSAHAQRGSHYLKHTSTIMVVTVVAFALLSIARCVALYTGYHAPLDLFMELSGVEEGTARPAGRRPINLCVGKEWHRFPSSFFLPDDSWQLRFLRSEFRGQLPQPFAPVPNGTAVVPLHMNDRNREEPTRYFAEEQCDYMVDLDVGEEAAGGGDGEASRREPNYSRQGERWQVVRSIPFLDAARSPPLLRAFYVPGLSTHHCVYAPYNLLRARRG